MCGMNRERIIDNIHFCSIFSRIFPVRISWGIVYPLLLLASGAFIFYHVDSIGWQILYIFAVVALSYFIQPKATRKELEMKIKVWLTKFKG